MDKTAQTLREHKNITQTVAGTIASMGLEKAGQKVAGVLVTPAVWAINYGADGSQPNAIDIGIYASGFISSVGGLAVGVVKSIVDDDMNKKLAIIQAKENPKYAPFIQSCYSFSSSAAAINAQIIASLGGTAWKDPIGLWVYITDARGMMIKDFKPKSYVMLYQPKPSLVKKNGKFIWGMVR